MLQGSEVKSLREGKAQLNEAYARVDGGEMWLFQLHIPPWQFATGFGAHDPDRKRKLLLHRGPDRRAARQDPATVAHPDPGLAVLPGWQGEGAIGPGQGRRLYDKRNVIKARDAEQEAARAGKEIGRWVG